MAAAFAAQHFPGFSQVSSACHNQASNAEACLDLQASNSGRLNAAWHGGLTFAGPRRSWSTWAAKTPLKGRVDVWCVAGVGKLGRCECRRPRCLLAPCRPASKQRRTFLAWCIAALVGGQVGSAYSLDYGLQPRVCASATLGQEQALQRQVEVNVVPPWAGIEAGHIIEDGGFPPTRVVAPGRRVVASGDFHGDLRAARRCLELAGVLSPEPDARWTGGNSVFVQVGDILDRGDDEIVIMSLLAHLSRQASAAGGGLYQVCGNHETMNVYSDFRYVTPGAFKECEWFDQWAREKYDGDHLAAFENWFEEAPLAKEQLKWSGSNTWNPLLANKGRKVRQQLFEAGGPLAHVMAGYSTVLQVNDSLFAHGGVLPHHVEYGLERLNREVSCWMLGHMDHMTGQPQEQPFMATRGFNSVMWSRLYSREMYDTGIEREQACLTLSKVLRMVHDAKRLIVGHTPQEMGANSECNGRIWRIDVGMSSGILQAAPQVLQISGNDVQVLSEKNADDLWVATYI